MSKLKAILVLLTALSAFACGDPAPVFSDAGEDVDASDAGSETGAEDVTDEAVEDSGGDAEADAEVDTVEDVRVDTGDQTDVGEETDTDDADTDAGDECLDPVEWYADVDGDGFGDSESTQMACEQPAGYVVDATDCDDGDDMAWEEVEAYRDEDGDGFGVGSKEPVCAGQDLPEGWSDETGDCDDSDANAYQYLTGYADKDGDGYTLSGASDVCSGTSLPDGYASSQSSINDCNDMDDTIFESLTGYVDADGDDYSPSGLETLCTNGSLPGDYVSSVNSGVDCDDSDDQRHPGKTEVCDASNIDEDCNGDADNDDPGADDSTRTDFWPDCDDDGYAEATAQVQRFCDEPQNAPMVCSSSNAPSSGWTTTSPSSDGDCHDENESVHPGVTSYETSRYRTIFGSMTYDYNCDLQEERQYTETSPPQITACNVNPAFRYYYWEGSDVPDCGDSGTLREVCTATSQTTEQACR